MLPKKLLIPVAAVAALSAVGAGPSVSRVDARGTADPECFTYDGYEHERIGFNDHIHGTGSPGGPAGYWEFEESTNWLSDETNHSEFENGTADDHDHTLQTGCNQFPEGE